VLSPLCWMPRLRWMICSMPSEKEKTRKTPGQDGICNEFYRTM
jgi:hypothetical protein